MLLKIDVMVWSAIKHVLSGNDGVYYTKKTHIGKEETTDAKKFIIT